jgi:hypothetical protein
MDTKRRYVERIPPTYFAYDDPISFLVNRLNHDLADATIVPSLTVRSKVGPLVQNVDT